jgi:hypothetical protein
MCFDGDNQVTQTLAITQLAKHQRKELVPTCEVLHITVSIVLVNDVTELVIIQECNQLGKNIFWFVHMQSSILTAKIQNQIVAPEKPL